jgi:hypothetical protein
MLLVDLSWHKLICTQACRTASTSMYMRPAVIWRTSLVRATPAANPAKTLTVPADGPDLSSGELRPPVIDPRDGYHRD